MLLFALASAQDSVTCLDRASVKIKTEGKIILLTKYGQQFTGHLLGINQSPSRVTIHKLDEVSRLRWVRLVSASGSKTPYDTATFPGLDIAEIKYFSYGQLKPEPIMGYTLFGSLAFGLIAAGLAGIDVGFGSGEKDREGAFLAGAAIGGAIGLVAGTIISLSSRTTKKIVCK
jgi:hypothetical protein